MLFRKLIRPAMAGRQLSTLKGYTILARGKRESESAPPRVTSYKYKPLIPKLRDSAKLMCGKSGTEYLNPGRMRSLPFHESADDSPSPGGEGRGEGELSPAEATRL
jgi:hypothetical protein